MDNINVLIIEDNYTESIALSEVLQSNNYNVVGIASSYTEALTLFYNVNPDIVIVDIFLNNKPDGITFAETIGLVPNSSKPFVFLTSSKDRQIFERAKLTQPFSYIIKPFNELEILFSLELAMEKFHTQNDVFLSDVEDTIISPEYLFIKKGKSLKKVKITSIIYIDVEEKYCNIITEKEKFVILISLIKILELLDQTLFFRTHRNHIVNIQKVTEIIPTDNLILLEGNHKAVLSKKYKDLLKKIHPLK